MSSSLFPPCLHTMIDGPFSLLRDFDPLQCAIWSKDDPSPFAEHSAARKMHMNGSVGLHQVHGTTTVVAREPMQRTVQADGVITDVPGLLLTVRWADCQNFVIFAPEKNVIGVLHAGWRGIKDGAIPAFFDVLKSEMNVSADEVTVGAGPSLCMRCSEFSDPETELPELDASLFDGRLVNLRKAAEIQMVEAGVKSDRFERMTNCTKCRPETYWTYRGGDQEQVKAGHTNALCCGIATQ